MATRTATATWDGNLQEGSGTMGLGSGAFKGPFSFKSRFEEGSGTNPEELLGAALAGCFSMALSLALSEAGASPQSVRSEAKVHLRQEDGQPTISRIDLTTVASVDGVDEAGFQEAAEATRKGCIVSRALAGVNEITLDATLES